MSLNKHPFFYDEPIIPDNEAKYINNILKKYRKEPVSKELQEKIWNELQHEKHLGNIKIPFKVVMKRSPHKHFPDTIEVILDTKV